jgi:uncharacterized membrane-anchored protein YhcB (DUF1043 family)
MKNDNIQNELTRLKEIIDNAKNNLATLNGRKIELLKQLKKEFGISSLEEAKEKIKKLQSESKELENKIEQDYKTLKEEYDW